MRLQRIMKVHLLLGLATTLGALPCPASGSDVPGKTASFNQPLANSTFEMGGSNRGGGRLVSLHAIVEGDRSGRSTVLIESAEGDRWGGYLLEPEINGENLGDRQACLVGLGGNSRGGGKPIADAASSRRMIFDAVIEAMVSSARMNLYSSDDGNVPLCPPYRPWLFLPKKKGPLDPRVPSLGGRLAHVVVIDNTDWGTGEVWDWEGMPISICPPYRPSKGTPSEPIQPDPIPTCAGTH